MTDARAEIFRQQQIWAANHNIEVDSSGCYTKALHANLFQPMHTDTLVDFQRGSGDELGENGRRGKMQALHSSSALAVNFFDYWRGLSLTWLQDAMSLSSKPASLCFEKKFPTRLPGNPPNLDVALSLTDGKTVTVESKFTETYTHANHEEPFKDSYFPIGDGLWLRCALPRCQRLAGRLRNRESKFQYMNVAQLLKHVLGLAQPGVGQFTLFYLWYAIPSEEATQHAKEVKEFIDEVGFELDFRTLTYQELFSSARRDLRGEHQAYLSYLEERYFSVP